MNYNSIFLNFFLNLEIKSLRIYKIIIVGSNKTITNEIDNEFPTVGDINAGILHKALLHGITPQKYIDGLEELLET